MRNIGISAHIDSGKTTLTERILYYCKKIHAVHEVRGKDGVGATMDSMELERERGITIASAATNVEWLGHSINIIDTPGHVDFTIEVERALRVLDGAILVLCSVGGVQSQTLSVDRQLKRYHVPRIAFINKCDRVGADPIKVKNQLIERLGHNAALIQLPIGLEEEHRGIIDLITLKALYFDGPLGETVREDEIPAEYAEQAAHFREEMMDKLTLLSDELSEAILEGTDSPEMIYRVVREHTLSQDLTPVLLGSAVRNKGVQPLLDAVVRFLPSPREVVNTAVNTVTGKEFPLSTDSGAPTVALAFKLEDGSYGQLTYVRVYQGVLRKGSDLINSRTIRSFRVGRLVRMHSDSMEEIESAAAGDIVCLFGIDCVSGDTFTAAGAAITMSPMHVPEPVISLAVKTNNRQVSDKLSKALGRFCKEDPTFRARVNQESGETIIMGMGELHLEVYLERIKREYHVEVESGKPEVAYRETISQRADFDYIHKKQTGGSGQYGRVVGYMEPHAENRYSFVSKVRGGAIPSEYITACDRGFESCLDEGKFKGYPVEGIRIVLTDGNHHAVDSSDLAFRQACIGAFREAYSKARPKILEPIMKVSVEAPLEYLGSLLGTIHQRRGVVISSSEDTTFCRIDAEVPLSEMFGYSTVIRSQTQGKGEFTMEFSRYHTLAQNLVEELDARK